ncbi:hypothetical protein BJ956_001954 [Arthrobacter psychrochitiniphilus]|nr:hypothetical protein [Arthrobacter psychrochitiniphilus]
MTSPEIARRGFLGATVAVSGAMTFPTIAALAVP